VRKVDNLTIFMCRLSKNLGASTSWDPKDLSRPVMGLLYLLHRICMFIYIHSRKMNPQYLHRACYIATGLYLSVQFRVKFIARKYIEDGNVIWNEAQ
jgi:hypothetical protein